MYYSRQLLSANVKHVFEFESVVAPLELPKDSVSRLVHTFDRENIFHFETQIMRTVMTTVEAFFFYKETDFSGVLNAATPEIAQTFCSLTQRNLLDRDVSLCAL